MNVGDLVRARPPAGGLRGSVDDGSLLGRRLFGSPGSFHDPDPTDIGSALRVNEDELHGLSDVGFRHLVPYEGLSIVDPAGKVLELDALLVGIFEDAFQRGLNRPIYLYWGVRKLADLYLPDLPQSWAREHANFHFIPVLSDAAPEDKWSGRTGLVHEAILEDFPDLKGHEIYACGSVKMVEAIFPTLKNQGAEEGMCFSDAFTISARSMAFQPK